MKIIIKIIVAGMSSMILCSCGTLGGVGDEVKFPISKKRLEIAIDSLYSSYPIYKIPRKWERYDDWEKKGYNFLESRIFYFKASPEEMYYVSFVGDSVMLADTSNIRIAVRSVFKEKNGGRWTLGTELTSEETKRIMDRFKIEIVVKLERFTNSKASFN